METSRLFIGGLYPEIKDEDLRQRFSRYGKINGIEIKQRRDPDGLPCNTFAYIDIVSTEADVKKCISTFNNKTWKSRQLQLQRAKESFLNRLEKERQQAKEDPNSQLEKVKRKKTPTSILVKPLESVPGLENFYMKGAPPGPILGQENWVVGKYGRVLPVIHLKKKGTNKVQRIDPSKLTHTIKKVADQVAEKPVDISGLTWEMPVPDSDATKKRKGEFPAWTPPTRKKRPAPAPRIEEEHDDAVVDIDLAYTKQKSDHQAAGAGRSSRDVDLSRFDSDTDSENDMLGKEDSGATTSKKSEGISKKRKLDVTPVGLNKAKIDKKQTPKGGGGCLPTVSKSKDLSGRNQLMVSSMMDEYYCGIPPSQPEGVERSEHSNTDDEYSDFESLVKAEEEKLKKVGAKHDLTSVDASVSLSTGEGNKNMNKKATVNSAGCAGEELVGNQGDFEIVSSKSKSSLAGPVSNVRDLDNKVAIPVHFQEDSDSELDEYESDVIDTSSEESLKAAKALTKSVDVRNKSEKVGEINSKTSVRPPVRLQSATLHTAGARAQLNSQSDSESDSSNSESSFEENQKDSIDSKKDSESESSDSSSNYSESDNVKKPASSVGVLTHLRPKNEQDISKKVCMTTKAYGLKKDKQEDSSESETTDTESDISVEKSIEKENDESTNNKANSLNKSVEDECTNSSSDTDTDTERNGRDAAATTEDVSGDINSSGSDSDFETLIAKEMEKVESPKNAMDSKKRLRKKRVKRTQTKCAPDGSTLTLEEKLENLKTKDNLEKLHQSDSSDSATEEFKPKSLQDYKNADAGHKDKEVESKSTTDEVQTKLLKHVKGSSKRVDEPVSKKIVDRKRVRKDTEEDRQETERKRMAAVQQRQKDHSAKQNAIKLALANLDAGAKPNKKVIFDSDSDGNEIRTTISKPKTAPADVKEPHNTKKASTLFDSSSESEEELDQSRFDIRPEFEGAVGRKLMKIQSRYANDERFKLTANFAESDSDSDDSDGQLSEDEKTKSLKILQSVVHTDLTKLVDKTAKRKKKFKDVSQLKYDPSKKEHSQFEIQSTPREQPQTSKKKKKKALEAEREAEAVPEVSQEKYYEVSQSVLNTFAKKEKQSAEHGFSLLAAFGKHSSDNERDDMDVEEPVAIPLPQILRTDQTSVENRFVVTDGDKGDNFSHNKGDKSGETQTGTTAAQHETTEKDDPHKSVPATGRSFTSSFFFTQNDSRLKEGEKIYKEEDVPTIGKEWNMKRKGLIQNYKTKQKKMKRRLKASGGERDSKRGGARGGRGGARGGRGGARSDRGGARGRGRIT